MKDRFTVSLHGTTCDFDTFEDAARFWARNTFDNPSVGGIEVRQFDAAGNCVRHGNLLSVRENGVVYVSPNMTV